MGRIKINQTTVCDREYFNTELLDVFPDEVCILGGGDTPEEAIAEMKENAKVYLDYILEEAERLLTS